MKKLTLFINTRRKKILRKIIQQKIVEINPKKILDNGCGKDGSFDYGVFEKRITTADILYGIDSENLPYSNNSFDCVIFAGVIQYLNNPDKALKECFRV
jgi:ubiquinone/menaquinone biosynthesis C-methylase UbiE